MNPECRHTHTHTQTHTDTHRHTHTHCASLRSRNAFQHLTRANLYRNLQEKAAHHNEPGTHTLCKPAQSKCMSTFQKSNFLWKFTGKMPQTKPAAHTLCEHAQSTCISILCKSQFIRKFAGKGRTPKGAQNAHFVRACAVEMPVNISQEPLHTEITRKRP